MIRINYESDFTCKVTLTSSEGTPMAPPSNPWSVHFTDEDGTCFRCSYDGTSYEDCTVENDAIICYVNNPGFQPGTLTVKFCNDIPDENFSDGYDNQVTPVTSQLLLWNGASDAGDAVDVGVILNIIAPRVIDATIQVGDLLLTFNT